MELNDTHATFARATEGCEDAARDIHDRYVIRLIALAHSRLSEKLAGKFDADDVVQSAFRSFFTRARDGQFAIQRAGDLWSLLAAITRHKLLKKAEHFSQEKRCLSREETIADRVVDQHNKTTQDQPTHEEAIALSDEVEFLMRQLDPLKREILEMRLSGKSIDQIANSVDRSERTVRRFLTVFTEQLENRLTDLRAQ